MNALIVTIVLMPILIVLLLFFSWKRNENSNPELGKIALIFMFVFLVIAAGLAVLYLMLS